VQIKINKFWLTVQTPLSTHKILSVPEVYLSRDKVLVQDNEIIKPATFYPTENGKYLNSTHIVLVDKIEEGDSNITEYTIQEDETTISAISEGNVILMVTK